MLLEICCENIESVLIASNGGADRIELCSSLETGGLTPSIELINLATEFSDVPLMILIRPRSGNFIYSDIEKRQTLREIESIMKLSIHGIVFGALNENNNIDIAFIKDIISIASASSLTFHRAFDFVTDPIKAIDSLIELGVDRILTSGQASTAEKGIDTLSKLITYSVDNISIMPGAGINSSNIKEIIETCSPKEIHLSAKKRIKNTSADSPFPIDHYLVDEEELMKINKLIS